MILLHTAATLSLTNDSASSTTANRFQLPNSVNWVSTGRAAEMIIYDGANSRWRLVRDGLFPALTANGTATFNATVISATPPPTRST